jgi:hypothetical protein
MHLGVFRSGVALVLLFCLGCATAPTANPTVKVGKKVTMFATADGAQPFSYRWEKDGQPIANATGATIVLDRVQLSDSGVYTCTVSNALAQIKVSHVLIVVP